MTASSARILLVEDSPDTARFMRLLLSHEGYDVETATSYSEAMTALDAEAFDLLICDIRLPDGSGHDIMRHAHQLRQIPGIAISGFNTDEDRAEGKRAGFSYYLAKPLDILILNDAIERLIR